MLKASEVTIRRNRESGWACQAIVNGYLMQRQYYGYTKREALAAFLFDANHETR